jgi:transposase
MHTATEPKSSIAREQTATLFVALELSKATWLVALHAPDRDRTSRHRLSGGDVKGLLALIDKARSRAETKLGRPVRIVSCYEAGYDGFRLHRLLHEHGINNQVLDPAGLLVDRRARRAKTDRLDLAGLLRTLMALCRGEPQVCRVVRVPSPDEEDVRRQHRERGRLIGEKVQHVGRIKGLLMTQGIRNFQPTRRDWQERLEGLRTGDGRALPACLAAEIERECRRLWLVIEMLVAVEHEIASRLQRASEPGAERIRRLMALTGIGPVCAGVLVREVFYRDFANRREVAHYPGLTPSPWRSGRVRREQGISKAGNPRARCMAIELAWLWLRHQPGSALAAWFRTRVGGAKGRLRRIMAVALARKLIVALWRYLVDGIVPEGAAFKAC